MEVKKLEIKNQYPSINLHLWKPCNYRCKFCFATFEDIKEQLPKGHISKESWIKILDLVLEFGFEKVNFAGGEPMLCPFLPELINYAKKIGLTTSIVTNGDKISRSWLEKVKGSLDWIAISIDSVDSNTLKAIGRCEPNKNPLSELDYLERCKLIHEFNIRLKINTVVNKLNFNENLSDFITKANPERWKILQTLSIDGQNNEFIDEFTITKFQFEKFLLDNQLKNKTIMVPESTDQIQGSYIMVSPAGTFFDDNNSTYNYSEPILNVGIENAIKQIHYDFDKFIQRGGVYNWQ